MHRAKTLIISLVAITIFNYAPNSDYTSVDGASFETTVLSIDPIPSEVVENEEVVFTGTLKTADGTGLANKTVAIVEQRALQSVVLTTAITNEEGRYNTIWNAEFDPETNQRIRLMTIVAAFEGSEKYSAAKSPVVKLKIAMKDWIVIFEVNKEAFTINETAIFTIRFYDRFDFVDPDTLTALYDGIPVNMTRLHKGSYVYELPQLQPDLHTFEIIAEKRGFDKYSNALTIEVSERPRTVRLTVDDIIPPISNVTIDGIYNNETGWYYSRFPVAIFDAVDEHPGKPSGIFHIAVQYMSKFGDPRCTKNTVCYLQPRENITLSRYNSVNDGEIILRWFAKDTAGNIEERHRVDLYVDTTPPKVSVLNIATDRNENVWIGSHCNKYEVHERDLNCVIVRAYTNETVTFSILADDQISGIKSTYYRVLPYSTVVSEDWQVLETESKPFPHKVTLNIKEPGTYRMQLRAEDVAGNESPVKQFVLRITNPPRELFELSINDFNVVGSIGSSGKVYYNISAMIENKTDESITGETVLIAKHNGGITAYIEIGDLSVAPRSSFNLEAQWSPNTVENFNVELYVLNRAAKPLASPGSISTVR